MSDSERWRPHVTVATIVKKDGRYLLVYEKTENGLRYNQPAGHLEPNESIVDAAARETLEETSWGVKIDGFVRLSQYKAPSNDVTYVRVTFSATALRHYPSRPLDKGIENAVWLTKDEIKSRASQMRSPMVLEDIEFFEANNLLPLAYVQSVN